MITFRGRQINDPGGIIGWLQEHHPTLLNMLFITDELFSGLIFQDNSPHTISWHIACAAKSGHWFAKMACEALNQLSPNHCAATIAAEGPCQPST